MTNAKVVGDYIKYTTKDGSQSEIKISAINTRTWKRGTGRPRNSDYLIKDLSAKERSELNKLVEKDRKSAKKSTKKSVKFIDKFNAYIWTLVVGLYMLAVLTESASKIRI